jgi:hypothetical protein
MAVGDTYRPVSHLKISTSLYQMSSVGTQAGSIINNGLLFSGAEEAVATKCFQDSF